MSTKLSFTSDVIIVGSGPGGATVARELSKAGKKVSIFERGHDHRGRFYYGTYPGAIVYSDRMSFLFTEEGLNIISPIMVGGATSMYCGCSAPPPPWFKKKYRIDIDKEVRETEKELGIAPLPAELRGKASTRIAEAAGALGYNWFPQPKFMSPARAKKFNCTAACMLGCTCNAKWNAGEWIDEALGTGAQLYTGAKISKVIKDGTHVKGIEGTLGGKSFTATAPVVILAAGGIGTPRILQASGLAKAGEGMAMDVTVMVYGTTKEKGIGKEPPMTWSWENDEDGYMLSTLIDPWLLYPLGAMRVGIKQALMWPKWGNILGVMIKLKDDISGGVYPGGRISKPLTPKDTVRLAHARATCERILIEAGASPSSIFMRPLMGTHPSGTVRIGTMLDTNLKTEIDGLYVCDASTFPESLDRPTVLTIIGLSKRLAGHLLKKK
ncbi:MAG: GMC family oxidoreductase [Spirochaetes bacterium]|nr:MAG: GMC family oxidoreductase [Spirochaetota bacterium]